MRGLLTLEEGPRIDFEALRLARRARVVEMMAANDVDMLMCTRQGNTRYIVGHRPLWRAVITPWAPMVTFVRSTQGIHLLAATWDDGLPADVPKENLNALTWNASNTVNAIRNISGLARGASHRGRRHAARARQAASACSRPMRSSSTPSH